MNEIDRFLAELDRALLTGGRRRRRALAECRDHLRDAAAEHGEVEAIRRFGGAAQFAAAIDGETAVRRASGATLLMVSGLVALAGSTLALVDNAETGPPVWVWAVVFFGAAQTSAVAALLAVALAVSLRRSLVHPGDLRLLGRRNLLALGFGLLTQFAAAAAVTGHGPPAALLSGPALALLALGASWGAWSLARHLDRAESGDAGTRRSDMERLLGPRVGHIGSTALLLTSAVVVATLAFAWNALDGGTVGGSFTAAGIETGLLLLGFLVLGRTLGLRQPRIAIR